MKVFWFDCETSGLDSARHGIISLAYAVEIDGHIVGEGELRSNCEGKAIEDSALAINHFTRGNLLGHQPPEQMYRDLAAEFSRWVDKFDRDDKFYAGGFNVGFDMGFLRQLWTDQKDSYFGSWFYAGTLDPLALIPAMKYMGLMQDFTGGYSKLAQVAEYLGIDTTGAHDAKSDLHMTRACFLALTDMLRASR